VTTSRAFAITLVRYVPGPPGQGYQPVERPLSNPDDLDEALAALWLGEPQFVDLLSPGGDVLCLGIGGERGCAGFGTWLMIKEGRTIDAVGDEDASDIPDEDIFFLAGGTPTPVAPSGLLSLEVIRHIARHFGYHADVPRDVPWE
jgi:hypothetical protein